MHGCGKGRGRLLPLPPRFISVKGPELLKKYVGASDPAVHELVQQRVAPAAPGLFFDEFDAIAPPRGRDSTGRGGGLVCKGGGAADCALSTTLYHTPIPCPGRGPGTALHALDRLGAMHLLLT